MECPLCHADNDYSVITVEPNAEEDGLEIGYTCIGCGTAWYVVLLPEMFETVA